MTSYVIYVGSADDPAYVRDDGDWSGNSPEMLSPNVFAGDLHSHHRLLDMIGPGQLPGKQTDWGCWVAIASKAQIIEFFDDVPFRDDTAREEMAKFLSSLDGQKQYALVALES